MLCALCGNDVTQIDASTGVSEASAGVTLEMVAKQEEISTSEVKHENSNQHTTEKVDVGPAAESVGLEPIPEEDEENDKDEDDKKQNEISFTFESEQRWKRVNDFNADIAHMEEEFKKLQMEKFQLVWENIE